MRNFNSEEKIYLKAIVEERNEQKYFLEIGRLLENLAIKENVIILTNKLDNIAVFLSEKVDKLRKENYSIDERRELHNIIYEEEYNLKRKTVHFLSLLDYLERNHLIYIYYINPNPILEDENFKGQVQVKLNNNLHIKDYKNKIELLKGEQFEYLFKKIDYAIIPSNELIEFVKNGFKDKEQLRHDDNVKLQKDALDQAKESTKAATRLGNVSILIAVLSFIAALMALVPESLRQQWFGITDKHEPVKQQVYIIDKGTVPDSIKKVLDKKPILKVKPNNKPAKPDTLKK
ncbi:hypothetical protein [Adhaeribacter rhizoryzae]|uniref:Uncharacterized protein n=1 Tax=Adhaeribacter rhizoryzae TaxID=2607907 RepID=A0A5M6DUQ0_9BACT|nr:hypothetical protein [Adhaeribacter rhizoryzae]KAA5549175.1 hypothetical protein F0145_00855 [Adhaeribacter rhizoryzae]